MRVLDRWMRWPLAAMFLPLLFLGCEVTPPEAAFQPEDRAAIEMLAETFAEQVLVEDWDGVAGLFRSDAVMMPPESPPVEER